MPGSINRQFSIAAICVALAACDNAPDHKIVENTEDLTTEIASVSVERDQFTYANYEDVIVTNIDLDLDVNFDEKRLEGMAYLDIKLIKPSTDKIILDTKDLTITAVSFFRGVDEIDGPTNKMFTLAEADPVLGSKLEIELPGNVDRIAIAYNTSPKAEGLQWLGPAQTAGKKHPYLFSQAQAINARTIAPLQDTPAVRLTYSANLTVPDGLRPLMSAEQGDQNPDGSYDFTMPQPIPSYLLAIAVGDIKFKAINDHIGVYAEDYILEASAEEFSETPLMEAANENLYGPYRWGRYDLIVLPPSFPYGGMENPRLSFLTPTLVAGDKSLTNVVAHELAHSWSGNLVTNATWRDAWLNEGFTSYVENRVMEDLYGRERAVMEQALALEDLKRDIAGADRPELTQLKLPDDMEHPDDAFSQVTYVKGQFFLIFLEERFGRELFDPFLRSYFDSFAFQSIRTEDFLDYFNANLRPKKPDAVTDAEIANWVYEPGLPDTTSIPQSDAFTKVDDQRNRWLSGAIPASELNVKNWSTHEWLHFLNGLPDGMTSSQFQALDDTFSLTGTQNAESAFAWYMQAIKGGYQPAFPELENFLMTVGRGKFIYRLYKALHENDQSEWAAGIYKSARPGYHPIAQRRIDAILSE